MANRPNVVFVMSDHTNAQALDNFGWQEHDCRECTSARTAAIPGSEVQVKTDGYPDYLLAGCGADEDAPSHPAYDKGVDFIRRNASGDQPFFCFVSSAEPHDPYIPPKRFLDLYDVSSLKVSSTLRDEPTGKPEVIARMKAVWDGMSDSDWQQVSAAYWASITFLDDQVGRLLQVLHDEGVYDNTIVVFTSDHGDMLGAHGLATKGVATSYEEVYNIPLVMRVPGNAARGENSTDVVSLLDLGPTLLDLCGLAELPECHGRSLRPVLDGTAAEDEWRDAYGEFYGQRFVYTQRIVWHEDWKYVFSPGGIDELYDLGADPCEQTNLAARPEHRPVLLDLVDRMWRKMEQIGDTSLLRTQYATLRTAPRGPMHNA